LEDVLMGTEETRIYAQPDHGKASIYADAQNPSPEIWATAHRRRGVLSTTSGPVVVAAVFCLVFLFMGSAFSFSTFASDLGRELNAGSGSVSFIFGCAMALLYAGGLFSGALADRIGTHRVAAAGALLAGGSLVAAGAVGRVWEADLTRAFGVLWREPIRSEDNRKLTGLEARRGFFGLARTKKANEGMVTLVNVKTDYRARVTMTRLSSYET
jgi:hypothetical protein